MSLPGFGCGTPDGFAATKDVYVDWLLSTLAALPAPIDLVGHDWGALLVRTWAAGGAPLDPEYVWHEAARAWQAPEVGERVMEQMTPEALRRALEAAGVPDADAAESSRFADATMKRCILALYRSAIHAGAEWTADLARVAAPGLVLWGERDPYAEARFGKRLAECTGARFVELPCSHWWQLERPDDVARELRRLWAG